MGRALELSTYDSLSSKEISLTEFVSALFPNYPRGNLPVEAINGCDEKQDISAVEQLVVVRLSSRINSSSL